MSNFDYLKTFVLDNQKLCVCSDGVKPYFDPKTQNETNARPEKQQITVAT
jgi:hypothetical protein